jgi:hypothetical protein
MKTNTCGEMRFLWTVSTKASVLFFSCHSVSDASVSSCMKMCSLLDVDSALENTAIRGKQKNNDLDIHAVSVFIRS